jgi:hypothetical protein
MDLNREGCVRSMQQQLVTWELSQHLLEDRKTDENQENLVEMAGRSIFLMHTDSSQQSGKQQKTVAT